VTGLSALNLPQPLVWILAFAIIFGLLAAFAHLMKRIAGGRAAELEGGRNRVPRLGLVDSFDLDRQRKLLIVRRDNVEHLILVGPTDVVVESNIVRAASAAPLRDDRQPTLQPLPAQPQGASAAPASSPLAQPAPPIPATPQMMQAPAATPAATPATTAPVMPTAPFPIPQPVRASEPRKSTMPPPPPFGAPKRGPAPTPQRIEPVLTAIAGGLPPLDKAAALAAETPAEPEIKTAAKAPEMIKAPEPPKASAAPETPALSETSEAITPASLAEPKLAPITANKASPSEATPVEQAPPPAEPAPAKPSQDDPLLADLSAKLQDVLKANMRPTEGLAPAAAPAPARPPLPPLPPIANPAASTPNEAPPSEAPQSEALKSAPMAAPQPAPSPAAAPAPTPAPAPAPVSPTPAPAAPAMDAFEEELRRILGRAPQKGS
jgi:flagellar protein FliO/FliZ